MTTKIRPNDELEGALLMNSVTCNILPKEQTTHNVDYGVIPPLPPPRNLEYNESSQPETLPLLPFEMEHTREHFDDESSELLTSTYPRTTMEKEKVEIESRRIEKGSSVGKMKKFEEHFEIKKGSKIASLKQHNEIEAIKLANQVAKIRISEELEGGLTLNEENEFTYKNKLKIDVSDTQSANLTKKEENLYETSSSSNTGGYEISDYELSHYEETEYKSDYNYKSIYD